MASPIKLSHIVLQTNKPRELREWYCQVLGAEIVQAGVSAAELVRIE